MDISKYMKPLKVIGIILIISLYVWAVIELVELL